MRELVLFYENFYAEPEEWRPQLEMINCPKITEGKNLKLEALFELQGKPLAHVPGTRLQVQMVSQWSSLNNVGTSSRWNW